MHRHHHPRRRCIWPGELRDAHKGQPMYSWPFAAAWHRAAAATATNLEHADKNPGRNRPKLFNSLESMAGLVEFLQLNFEKLAVKAPCSTWSYSWNRIPRWWSHRGSAGCFAGRGPALIRANIIKKTTVNTNDIEGLPGGIALPADLKPSADDGFFCFSTNEVKSVNGNGAPHSLREDTCKVCTEFDSKYYPSSSLSWVCLVGNCNLAK